MIIEFPATDAIEIPKTEEFLNYARQISAFIYELPLTKEQNDELIAMLVEHLSMRAEEAFRFGFSMGCAVGHE